MAQPQMTSESRFEFLQYQVRGRVLQADALPNVRWRDIILNLFYGPRTNCDAEPNSPGQKVTLATNTTPGDAIEVPNLGTITPTGFLDTFMAPLLDALSIGYVNNGVYGRWFDDPLDPFEPVGSPGMPGVSPAGAGAGATIAVTSVGAGGVITGFTAVPVAPGTGYAVGDIIVLMSNTGVNAVPAIFQVTGATAGVIDTVAMVQAGSGYSVGTYNTAPSDTATVSFTAAVAGGPITSLTTNVPPTAGTGYTPGQILKVTGGGGTGGTVVVLTVNPITGAILTLGLESGGTGYTTNAAAATEAGVDESYSYSAPIGDGAVAGDRLPLDNNATIRRYTAVRGKNWRGNIRPAPIAESQTLADQFTPAAQILWKAVANGMYSPISDGESILYPLLVSATESQLIRKPTRVAYAPLVMPGIDPVTGNRNAVVDLALGESKRRKERKSLTF